MDNEPKTENIRPDAAGTYYAIRNSGYENKNAIADLIDNSIDASAKNIRISIGGNTSDGLPQIVIADDGCGMSMETLRDALCLGKTSHSTEFDLGKYGFGLKSASLSIARRIKIITRNKGKFSVAIFDYDQICETNRFYAEFREANDAEMRAFYDRVKVFDSGTVVILSKCDRLAEMRLDKFERDLKDFIRRVFRAFMRDGNCITVNDLSLQFNDPLWLDDSRTKKVVDKEVTVMSGGTKKSFHVLVAVVPDFGQKVNRDLGFNIKNQGFYFMRNNREIAAGYEISELFKKHNDYNFTRIELSFDSSLDDEMNINFTKHNAAPNSVIIDALKTELDGAIKQIRKDAKEKQKQQKVSVFEKVAEDSGTGTSTANERTVESDKYEFVVDFFDVDQGSFKATKCPDGDKIKIDYNLSGSTYIESVKNSADPQNSRVLMDKMIKAILEVCRVKHIDGIEFINAVARNIDGK